MIMDNSNHIHHQHQHQHQHSMNAITSPQRADLKLASTPPKTLSPSNNNNNETRIPPTISASGKAGLKRAFDVAFLMMPDERIKQKQAEKQARLVENFERHPYPTDLSSRQLMAHQQHLQHLHEQTEFLQLQEARRYSQISISTTPRIYDDPSVIISDSPEPSPLPPIKSAFTKVINARLESPIPPGPPLSPDQLSCSSLSPPIATTPPRTNSGNGSLSNGSTSNSAVPPTAAQLNPNIVYQNFRPEYNFNGAFHTVNQVQALQAAAVQNQRIKQQLLYRAPINVTIHGANSNGGPPPPEFFPGYPGFPFPPGAAQHFASVAASPEMTRIPLQNPAAAAIFSTLIPPTLASTFTLTAQNVCAKCNISFRMTSDLVYHMRSHHKSEVACDPNRRKREEKLKCPVCNESFRERHHLTRHMTAHQDKESDSATTTTGGGSGSDQIINVGGGSRHHSRSAAISK